MMQKTDQWGKESILMGQKAQAWVGICYLAESAD